MPPGFPPTATERFGKWWKRQMDHPTYKWVTMAGLAALSVVVVAGGVLLARPQAESVDGFISRWNQAVVDNDESRFNNLLAVDLIESNPTAYTRGMDLLRELHYAGKQAEPIEAEVMEGIIVIPTNAAINEDDRTAALTFSREAGDVTFQLEVAGWGRKWRVTDISTTAAPIVREPEPSSDMDMALPNGAFGTTTMASLEQVSYTPPDGSAPLDTEFKLKQILEVWRTSWEEKEIDAYMAWYADYAKIKRVTVVQGKEFSEELTKTELRRRMERIVERYGTIEVGVSNVRVTGDRAVADLNFRQEYSAYTSGVEKAPVYQDIGIKTLKFVNDGGEWKIFEEDWHTYIDVPSYPLN
ncbi:MAG: hypothetical protein O3A46_13985 [Candidatus Poribacteria bacterium]|nr:hypothetical protein [Candidatus Poribacteria bacterium]